MKKFFYILFFSLFLFIPGFASALELSDGTLVDSTNAHLFIEENVSKFVYYDSFRFPNGFKSYVISSWDDKTYLTKIVIYNSYNSYDRGSYYEIFFNGPFLNIYYDSNKDCFLQYWNSTECFDMSSSSINISPINGNDYYSLDKITYVSEDLYFNDILLMKNNFNSIPKFYSVLFNIPNGSTLIVKNSNNEVVNPLSDYNYNLESGSYSFSVSKSLYKTYNGSFDLSDNITIDVELDPIMDLENYSNIFSKYKNYLLYLIPNIFNLENPFFFIVFGVFILFSLFLFLLKFMKGRF